MVFRKWSHITETDKCTSKRRYWLTIITNATNSVLTHQKPHRLCQFQSSSNKLLFSFVSLLILLVTTPGILCGNDWLLRPPIKHREHLNLSKSHQDSFKNKRMNISFYQCIKVVRRCHDALVSRLSTTGCPIFY